MSPVVISRKIFNSLLGLVMLCSGGCIYLVAGGVGALGGYAVSPDTVEGVISGFAPEEIFDAAFEVVSMMGVIEEESPEAGILIASVGGARVTVTVVYMSRTATKLLVKARKSMLPQVQVAQDIYLKIESELAGGDGAF